MNTIESKFYVPALIGVLLVLSNAISSISCSFRDRYSERVPTYKITVPRKVSEDGTFVSHYLPHFYDVRRKKRDLSSDEVHYIIPVEGVEHHIRLWPSSDFLSPGLVVEHHTLKGNTSHITVRKMRDTQCHYRGIVRGVDHSSVSLSTCYGLAGQVKTPQTGFIIEPLLRENNADEYHRHYIYKREDVAARTKNITNCGTKGKFNEAWEQRMDWERKYGEKIEKSISSSIFGDTSYATHIRRPKRSDELCTPENPTVCPHDQLECPLRAPHFLEVMVCVDYKLEKEFEQDIETFISTVFNMVTANFHDESVGHTIHVKLVRLLYLSYTIPRLDVSRFSPSGLLQNFCDWQLELNPLLESHPNHHDIAVFITRFEPCQGNVLGLTNMASICRLDKACAVVSEEGLLLANIITHQLGHSLGAEHDDGGVGGCAGEEPDGTRYHMSPFISLSSSAWSTCSRQCLSQFIETRISWCLADPPDEHDFRSPDILPGQVYNAIKQCSLNFKMRTLACRTGDFCKTLYCQISDSKCATTGDPPADGTPCAMNMWCFNGYCVHRGQRPGAIHGQWGPWTAWSSCTRSCGGGVQSKYRACDNPPPSHGGRYCFGSWMTFRMCSIQPCIGYVPTFLQVQCKMTDKRPYKGHYFMWDHIRTFFEDMKCTLVCINELKQVSIRSPVVIDGTPCEPGTNNVCIQGLCRRVGCDYVIESKSKEDMCGTCHGPGIGCKLVQGLFNEPNIQGVVPILQLPARTSMIYLREVDQSACYFIISSSANSTFYLNGPTNCDNLPGEFNCAGTTGVYDDKLGVSRIFVKGPIEAAITVSIKCQDESSNLSPINKGIRYQYALPETDKTYVPSYRWAYLYWEACNRACGGGTQRSKAACLEKNGGEVEDKYCSEFNRPVDVIRACNIKPCTAKWWVGSWSNCDCQDGDGIMTRIVLCMKSMKEDNSIAKVVKDKECCYQPKPTVQRPCSEENNMRRRKRQKPVDPMDIVTFPSPSANKKSYINNDFDWNEDYLQRLRDENRQHPVVFDDAGEADEHYATETERIERKKLNKKKARRRKKLHSNKNNVSPVLPFSNSSSTFEEESQTVAPKQVKPVGKSANRDMGDSNQDDREDPSSKPLIYAKGSKNLNLKSGDDLQTVESSVVGSPSTACPSDLATEVIRTTNSTSQSTCTSDFFFDHVLQGGRPYQTSCSPDNDEMEPADLGPLLESANNSLYKMIIISVIPDKNSFPKTDLEIQTFGDSAFWPIGSCLNTTYISGDTIFKILQEARRRGTKPPLIEPDTG